MQPGQRGKGKKSSARGAFLEVSTPEGKEEQALNQKKIDDA